METIRCQHCNKKTSGSKRRKFCSDSCRVAHWQKANRERKAKLTRPALVKKPELSVEELQLRVILYAWTLKDMALEGNKIALDALEQVEKILNQLEWEMRKWDVN